MRDGSFMPASEARLSQRKPVRWFARPAGLSTEVVPIRHCPNPARQFRRTAGNSAPMGQPAIVVAVEYRQRVKEGLRHATLKGLRSDKTPGLIGDVLESL